LNQLMILNTKLLEATTAAYAQIARDEYEFEHYIWKELKHKSKHYAEEIGEVYIETPFEYQPFATVEQRIEYYDFEYHIGYLSSLKDQLKVEHDYVFECDFGDCYTFSPIDDSFYFETPFNERVAFFVVGEKGLPQCYIDINHPLYLKIKSEVSRVTK